MSTDRLETFSDGVFAIAITLLVLEIEVPRGEGSLGRELLELWPSYLAYATSFITIGIIWVNHHFQFERTVSVNRPLLYMNLFLLMVVAFIPFPTAVLAEHLRSGDDESVAAAFYAGVLLLMSLGFKGLADYTDRAGLLKGGLPEKLLAALRKRGRIGGVGYLAAIAVAFLSAPASVAICAAVAIFYIFPGREVSRLRAELNLPGPLDDR